MSVLAERVLVSVFVLVSVSVLGQRLAECSPARLCRDGLAPLAETASRDTDTDTSTDTDTAT